MLRLGYCLGPREFSDMFGVAMWEGSYFGKLKVCTFYFFFSFLFNILFQFCGYLENFKFGQILFIRFYERVCVLFSVSACKCLRVTGSEENLEDGMEGKLEDGMEGKLEDGMEGNLRMLVSVSVVLVHLCVFDVRNIVRLFILTKLVNF